jgi:hypothetical protein
MRRAIVDWHFNAGLWKFGGFSGISFGILGRPVSIEMTKQSTEFPGLTDASVQNTRVDRPVDQSWLKRPKCLPKSQLKCPKWHFGLSQAIEI